MDSKGPIKINLCDSNEKNSEWQCSKWSPWSECQPNEIFKSTKTTDTNLNTSNRNITAECGKKRECLEGSSKGDYNWVVCQHSSGPECLSTPQIGQCSAYDYGSCGPTCIQCGCCVEPETFAASVWWFIRLVLS